MSIVSELFEQIVRRLDDAADTLSSAGYGDLAADLLELGDQFRNLIALGDDLSDASLTEDLNAEFRAVVNSVIGLVAGGVIAVAATGPLLALASISATGFTVAVTGIAIGFGVDFAIDWLSRAGITVVGSLIDFSGDTRDVTYIGTTAADAIIVGPNTGNATIDGSLSFDRVSYVSNSGVNVSFDLSETTIYVDRNGKTDALRSIEELVLGGAADIINFRNLNREISLQLGGGNDTVIFLSNPNSNNEIYEFNGQSGVDTLDFSNLQSYASINLQTEQALVGVDGARDVYNVLDFENVVGTKGKNDIIGDDEDNRIDGNGGEDTIDGGLGVDTYIVDGDDTIRDSDGQGKVYFINFLLEGGTATSCEAPTSYTGRHGEIYSQNGSSLTVIANS
jgi:hypothetical protein